MHQKTRSGNLRCHVGKLELDRLKLGDRLSELLALLCVMQRGFICALRHAHGQCSDADSAAVKNLQGVDEAVAWLAEQVLFRNAAIVKDDGRGVTGPESKCVFLFP